MAEGEEREDKRAVDEFLKAEGSKHKEFVEISLKAGVTYSSLLNFLKIKPRKLVPVEVKRHQIEISSLNQSRRMECAKRDAEDLEIVQKKVKIDPVISSGTTGIDQQPENEDLQDAVMEPFHLECLDKFREGIEMSRPWDFVRLVVIDCSCRL